MCLRHNLRAVAVVGKSIWAAYLQHGPGKLDPKLLLPLDAAIMSVRHSLAVRDADSAATQGDSWREDINATICTIEVLLHRCIERTEGLSFVTGEAGLIPRHDLYEQCIGALTRLDQLIHQLPA